MKNVQQIGYKDIAIRRYNVLGDVAVVGDVEYLTVEQAAVVTGRSPSTIWRRVRSGDLRSWKILRRTVFRRDDVEALRHPLEPPAPEPDE